MQGKGRFTGWCAAWRPLGNTASPPRARRLARDSNSRDSSVRQTEGVGAREAVRTFRIGSARNLQANWGDPMPFSVVRMRLNRISGFGRAGLVAGSQVGALAVAVLAFIAYAYATSGRDRDASSGRYAFADVLYFLQAFPAASVVPTCLLLYFLAGVRWTLAGGLHRLAWPYPLPACWPRQPKRGHPPSTNFDLRWQYPENSWRRCWPDCLCWWESSRQVARIGDGCSPQRQSSG